MAVTPKGIVTPDASSPYNLITDLNTLASTTDAAIATLKGTASQRTAALAGAPDGTLWQDTDGIKMIWRKDGAVWVPAVWRWSGTTAQMNAFTQAPNGFEWYNSSTNFTYIRLAGAWQGGVVTLSPATGFTNGGVLPAMTYRVDGDYVEFSGGVTGTFAADGYVVIGTIPEPLRSGRLEVGAGLSSRAATSIYISASGQITVRPYGGSSTWGGGYIRYRRP